ncbi:MAG TPA: zf-TFIIB domain-containing protein, partial [Nitrospiria bacterium]
KELGEHGYDKEEEYFFKKNKALIGEMREKLDESRSQQAAHAAENPHWMKCPKCGKTLAEEDLAGIKVDQCTHCLGIFFDKGELELLLEAKEPAGIFGSLKKIFKK